MSGNSPYGNDTLVIPFELELPAVPARSAGVMSRLRRPGNAVGGRGVEAASGQPGEPPGSVAGSSESAAPEARSGTEP